MRAYKAALPGSVITIRTPGGGLFPVLAALLAAGLVAVVSAGVVAMLPPV